jgi:CAAX protease family protein
MKAALLSQVVIALLILGIIVLVGMRRAVTNPRLIGLFFAISLLDNLIIVTTNQFPQLQFVPNGTWQEWLVWGWSGKLYSVIACLIVATLIRSVLSRQDLGLTLRQNPGSLKPALLVLVLMGVWSAFIGMSYPEGPFDSGMLLYMAILPGMNEELVYRGLLLGTLDRVFRKSWIVFGGNLGWGAIITSLLFGLLHGFWFDAHLGLHIDFMAVVFPGALGFVDAWLRERTGSLLMPILTHGVEDFLIFLFRML